VTDVEDISKIITITLSTEPEPDIKIIGLSYPETAHPGTTIGLQIVIHNYGSKSVIAYGRWWELAPNPRSLTYRRQATCDPGETKYLGVDYLTVPNYPVGTQWKLRAVAGYLLSQPPEPPEEVQQDYEDITVGIV